MIWNGSPFATCRLVNNKNNNRPDVGWDESGKCLKQIIILLVPRYWSGHLADAININN